MFFFLEPFLPFLSFLLLLIKPLQKSSFPSFLYQLSLLSFLLFRESIHHSFQYLKNWSIPTMPFKKCRVSEAEDLDLGRITLLDLPELAIERILEKLSPADLCGMSAVCGDLRGRCTGDHLWKIHMREKWSRVIGDAAWKKWGLEVESRRDFYAGRDEMGGFRANLWRFLGFMRRTDGGRKFRSVLPVDSLACFYQALESGRFSFPAQVYNRENGNAGFLLSCYDAEISYNSRTNKFYVRYPPHGKKVPAIEEVAWERIRAHVGTLAHDLHVSDCLSELNPGDHIEIQWRRNKEFPYGWWYGVVGHLDVCDRGETHCCCHASDTIVLEFNHYSPGSRWRRKFISRKEHREDGSEDGFYGGIRKVQKEEIPVWKQFCPSEVQD